LVSDFHRQPHRQEKDFAQQASDLPRACARICQFECFA
jgi:hypothetical protein